MSDSPTRRQFLAAGAATVATLASGPSRAAAPRPPIFKSCKWGTIKADLPLADYLKLYLDLGFDGVEFNSPTNFDLDALRRASDETGVPIHGVINSIHWQTRLSDPDPAVREKALQGLLTSLRDCHKLGGNAVLLVPGRVANAETENQQQVWDRSIEQIRLALPTAAKLGVRILIENVWNGFCYQHDGPEGQSAEQLVAYLDAIDSPWVGSYFDIGNHQKYAKPADWIRALGRRIVKLDVKDWGKANGFCEIGAGDVDWPEVRRALAEIGYRGWATAEVKGGDPDYVREKISRAMDTHLLGL